MRRAASRLIAALSTTLWLTACAQVAAPPPPVMGPTARLPDIGESVIKLHASADYTAISAAANSAVSAQVVDLAAVDIGHGVTFKLTGQRSDITVARVDTAISFRAPVHVDGLLDSRCVIITHCYGTLSVDGRVWGVARPSINPDWTLTLAPSGGFEIDKAEVRFPLFPPGISVKDPVAKALKKPFDKLVFDVDDAAARTTLLKSAVQAAWTELGRPIAVSADPQVWLTVHPTRILTEQPVLTDRGVELDLAMIARPELVVGDRPPDADPGPLPDLNIVPAVPDQFSIYLPVRLTWQDANALALRNMVGKELPAGGGVTVRIDDVAIFDNGDEVGVKIAFRARTKGSWAPTGTVYLLGRPVYHLEDGYIAVEKLHLDIQTRDLVLKVASWLGRQSMIDDLEARLRFDMRAQVAARRNDLDRALNAVQPNPRISLAGAVTSLAPSAVYLTQEGMQVNVVALGTLKVTAR